jgi:hypothetical protein
VVVVTEADAEAVVSTANVDVTPASLARARDYLVRRRRGRRYGLILGLVAGFGPLGGDPQLSLLLPRLLAGYLIGLLISELRTPRPTRPSLRAASLHHRSTADLVPVAGRLLPWLTLVPLFASPALAIGHHPRGTTRISGHGGFCSATAYWPRTGTLIAVAGLAAFALLTTIYTLRRLAHRAQPADDPDMVTLDRALRGRSARSALAASTALGLAFASVVGQSVYQGVHSYVCTPLTLSGRDPAATVYSWGTSAGPWLQHVSLGLFIAALVAWLICQRLPLPGQNRRTARG